MSSRPDFRPSLSALWRATLFLWALGAPLLLASCFKPDDPKPEPPTTVGGRVVYSDDVSRGVPGVLVRAVGKSSLTSTDSTGRFSFSPPHQNGEFMQFSFTKAGFVESIRTLTIQSGVAHFFPEDIRLTRSGTGGGPGNGGFASNIVLKSVSTASIGVRGSGDDESARLEFEVRDSSGRAVDFGRRATVRFELTQVPGGGAFVSPDTVSTDANGIAAVIVNAGTLAQAVQVRAQVIGTSIFSDRVSVAIHGGPPDARHFSFAPEKLNVPARFGLTNRITAYVGDQFGNPVPAGTAVYFSTTGGIIGGSATTDALGRAAVDLVVAEPLPNSVPAFSDSAGIARVSAQTVGANQTPIITSRLAVLFSGQTEVIVTPTTFDIPVGQAQDFTVTAWDREHHNPLSEGTVIAFAATAGELSGVSRITLPDTQDKLRYTTITFRLENRLSGPVIVGPARARTPLALLRAASSTSESRIDGRPAIQSAGAIAAGVLATPSVVTVGVTSPNGDATVVVRGTLQQPPP